MPSHRDVARLNDLLQALVKLVQQAVETQKGSKSAADKAGACQEAVYAAAEVFREMRQQVNLVVVSVVFWNVHIHCLTKDTKDKVTVACCLKPAHINSWFARFL